MYTQVSTIIEGKVNKLLYFPVCGNAPCAGPVTSVTAPVHQRQGNPQPQPKQLQRVRLPSWKRFRRGRTFCFLRGLAFIKGRSTFPLVFAGKPDKQFYESWEQDWAQTFEPYLHLMKVSPGQVPGTMQGLWFIEIRGGQFCHLPMALIWN